jgi:hypothetical protein
MVVKWDSQALGSEINLDNILYLKSAENTRIVGQEIANIVMKATNIHCVGNN